MAAPIVVRTCVTLVLFIAALGGTSHAQPRGDWIRTGSMTVPRSHHTATLLDDGRVLVAGGQDLRTGQRLNTAEIYDPEDEDPATGRLGTWKATGSLQHARHSHAAVRLPDGRVMVVSGAGTTTVEIFDPANDSWREVVGQQYSQLATVGLTGTPVWQSAQAPAEPIRHFVLFGGGVRLPGDSSNRYARLFDVASETWLAVIETQSSAGYVEHTATLLTDGTVLYAGGASRQAQQFDPETMSWSNTAVMNRTRPSGAAALLGDGSVLITGGGGNNDPGAAGLVERFVPAHALQPARWIAMPRMNVERQRHTATLLANANVLVAGGTLDGTAEIFAPTADLTSGEWQFTPFMHTVRREGHTATRLDDGRVLVVGGARPGLNGLESIGEAEVYDPGAPPPAGGRLRPRPGKNVELCPWTGPPRPVPMVISYVDSSGNVVFINARPGECETLNANADRELRIIIWGSAQEDRPSRRYETGPGERNPDGRPHALLDWRAVVRVTGSAVSASGPSIEGGSQDDEDPAVLVRFELDEGGYDFGDAAILLTGVTAEVDVRVDDVPPVPFEGTASFQASVTDAAAPLPGRLVSFALDGRHAGATLTDADGVARLEHVPVAGLNAGIHPGAVTASVVPEGIHAAGSDIADLTIEKLVPEIYWDEPLPITEGTALSATQLNATATLPGTLVYSPGAGTILPPGAHPLAVQFTPTDQVNHASGSGTVTLVVEPAARHCAFDAGAGVSVQRGGFRLNRASNRFVQAVTLKNIGATPVQGPVSVIIHALPSGVTLYGATGITSCVAPAGAPYVDVQIGPAGVMMPGETAVVTLEFVNPSRTAIRYEMRVVHGDGQR